MSKNAAGRLAGAPAWRIGTNITHRNRNRRGGIAPLRQGAPPAAIAGASLAHARHVAPPPQTAPRPHTALSFRAAVWRAALVAASTALGLMAYLDQRLLLPLPPVNEEARRAERRVGQGKPACSSSPWQTK